MFKGLGNLGNIASMVGSLQELPEKLKELNERLKQETVTGTSSCGNVTFEMSGTGAVQGVKIDGNLSGPELELALQDAANTAGAAAKQLYADSIQQLVSDLELNLPGLDSVLSTLTGGR